MLASKLWGGKTNKDLVSDLMSSSTNNKPHMQMPSSPGDPSVYFTFDRTLCQTYGPLKSSEQGIPPNQRSLFREAFSTVSKSTGIKFTEVTVDDDSNLPNIVALCSSSKIESRHELRSPMAFVTSRVHSVTFKGQIFKPQALKYFFVCSDIFMQAKERTLADLQHEILHIIGLDHPQETPSASLFIPRGYGRSIMYQRLNFLSLENLACTSGYHIYSSLPQPYNCGYWVRPMCSEDIIAAQEFQKMRLDESYHSPYLEENQGGIFDQLLNSGLTDEICRSFLSSFFRTFCQRYLKYLLFKNKIKRNTAESIIQLLCFSFDAILVYNFAQFVQAKLMSIAIGNALDFVGRKIGLDRETRDSMKQNAFLVMRIIVENALDGIIGRLVSNIAGEKMGNELALALIRHLGNSKND